LAPHRQQQEKALSPHKPLVKKNRAINMSKNWKEQGLERNWMVGKKKKTLERKQKWNKWESQAVNERCVPSLISLMT